MPGDATLCCLSSKQARCVQSQMLESRTEASLHRRNLTLHSRQVFEHLWLLVLIAGSVLGPVQFIQCGAIKILHIVLCLSIIGVHAAAAPTAQQNDIQPKRRHSGQCYSLYRTSLQRMLALICNLHQDQVSMHAWYACCTHATVIWQPVKHIGL